MTSEEFEKLKAEIQDLRKRGLIPDAPTREQKIDWAYGNAAIDNPEVTREMVEKAVDRLEKFRAKAKELIGDHTVDLQDPIEGPVDL